MALQESMIYDENGQLLSGSFMDYALPRAADVPNFEVVLVENPSPHGPFGARGIAEPPVIPGPAAIANAIYDATGVRMTRLPMSLETVWRALQNHA
jgi:CO/xanthine dehydrogenase Mo-binding subunit